jgi:peptidoglycan hydrolase-like protein with peptidoglycan-binding domain
VPTVHFELVLTDELAPFVGETYKVEGLPRPITDTVRADRLVKLDVPVHVREVRLVFEKRGLVLPIRIGDLDPASEPSGVRTRLENLGYLRASAEPLSEREADERLVTAIRHFQRDHGLEPTGENDPPFQAELVAAHGS